MGYNIKDDVSKEESEFCKDLIYFLSEKGFTPKTAAPLLAKSMFLIEHIDSEIAGSLPHAFKFKKEYLCLIMEKK